MAAPLLAALAALRACEGSRPDVAESGSWQLLAPGGGGPASALLAREAAPEEEAKKEMLKQGTEYDFTPSALSERPWCSPYCTLGRGKALREEREEGAEALYLGSLRSTAQKLAKRRTPVAVYMYENERAMAKPASFLKEFTEKKIPHSVQYHLSGKVSRSFLPLLGSRTYVPMGAAVLMKEGPPAEKSLSEGLENGLLVTKTGKVLTAEGPEDGEDMSETAKAEFTKELCEFGRAMKKAGYTHSKLDGNVLTDTNGYVRVLVDNDVVEKAGESDENNAVAAVESQLKKWGLSEESCTS